MTASVKHIEFRVGIDLLSGPGWEDMPELETLIRFAQTLDADLSAAFPGAEVYWRVEPHLGIVVEWDRIEIESARRDDDMFLEEQVLEQCKRIANRVFEASERWAVQA